MVISGWLSLLNNRSQVRVTVAAGAIFYKNEQSLTGSSQKNQPLTTWKLIAGSTFWKMKLGLRIAVLFVLFTLLAKHYCHARPGCGFSRPCYTTEVCYLLIFIYQGESFLTRSGNCSLLYFKWTKMIINQLKIGEETIHQIEMWKDELAIPTLKFSAYEKFSAKSKNSYMINKQK